MSFIGSIDKIAKATAANTEAAELNPDPRAMTGFEPHLLQAMVLPTLRRFNVGVYHRRFGKTVMMVNKLIEHALHCPFTNGRYAYLAPTYSQAEDVAWMYLDQYTEGIPGRKVELAKLAITIPTYQGGEARIRLYGVDSPKQRLRGLYLDGVVLDEYPWMPLSVWTDQVRPMLSDKQRSGADALGRRNQWADFIFTPFGRNHAYTMYKNAKIWQEGGTVAVDDGDGNEIAIGQDDWTATLMPVSETQLIDAEELRAVRATAGRSKYEREYECSFDADIEGAIFGKEMRWLHRKGRLKSYPVIPGIPVNTAWDLGWDDHTSIVFFQVVNPEDIRIVDHYSKGFASLSHYADVMVEKNYMYGYNIFPHDVEVTELGTGKSRRAILQSLGVRVSTIPGKASLSKQDMIHAAQALLPYCRFNSENCEALVDNLSLYRRNFNETTQTYGLEPAKGPQNHDADALQMLALGLRVSGSDLEQAQSSGGRAIR